MVLIDFFMVTAFNAFKISLPSCFKKVFSIVDPIVQTIFTLI